MPDFHSDVATLARMRSRGWEVQLAGVVTLTGAVYLAARGRLWRSRND